MYVCMEGTDGRHCAWSVEIPPHNERMNRLQMSSFGSFTSRCGKATALRAVLSHVLEPPILATNEWSPPTKSFIESILYDFQHSH